MKSLRAIICLLLFSSCAIPVAAGPMQGGGQFSLQEIYKKNSPAVVVIEMVNPSGSVASLGSGFVVSPSGVIVTNYHVIAPQSGLHAVVKLANGDKYDDVWVVHTDERRDFAVISIKATGLPTVTLGDSEKVEIGEEVVAIGSPMGLESTFTAGVVSGIRSDPDGYRFIQHQTPISGGSSGSPLFTKKGEVVGINTFTVRGGQNLNGAVPINYAKPYLQDAPKMTYATFAGLQPQPSQPPAPSANEYRSESGRFVTEFPGTPTVQEQEDKDTGLMFHQFVVSGGGRLFFVLYTDYPEAEIEEKGADKMMDADRDNFVSGVKGKIDEEKRVACGDYPGRRLIITTEEGRWYALRICFARPRMYMILAGSRDGPLPEDTGARFLNAFKILPKPQE